MQKGEGQLVFSCSTRKLSGLHPETLGGRCEYFGSFRGYAGFRFRVLRLGFPVQGLGFRVFGSGFRAV